MSDPTPPQGSAPSPLTQSVLVEALDAKADRYCEALEALCSPTSTAVRARVVETARLLVTCHDMWLEAREAGSDATT